MTCSIAGVMVTEDVFDGAPGGASGPKITPVLFTNIGSSLFGSTTRLMVLVALVAGEPVPPPASVTVMLKLSLDVSLPLWLEVKSERLALVMLC